MHFARGSREEALSYMYGTCRLYRSTCTGRVHVPVHTCSRGEEAKNHFETGRCSEGDRFSARHCSTESRSYNIDLITMNNFKDLEADLNTSLHVHV